MHCEQENWGYPGGNDGRQPRVRRFSCFDPWDLRHSVPMSPSRALRMGIFWEQSEIVEKLMNILCSCWICFFGIGNMM